MLIILSARIFAQTWAPTAAIWHYSFNQMLSYGYVEIEYTNDTILLGNNCKTFQKTQYGYTYPGVYDTLNLGEEFTYLDSIGNVVYRYFNGKFDTLYYFNAQIGDKWKVRAMEIVPDSGVVVVDSIGYRVINNDTLKSLFVSTIEGSCVGWESAEIIERIGCINDYMFPNYVSCTVDLSEGGPLRCYADDDFPIFITGESSYCDFITSIGSYVGVDDFIEVYPNPTSSSIFIKSTNKKMPFTKIVLLSSLSQKILEYDLNLKYDFQIDISNLKPGLYFLQVTNNEGAYSIEKIIKE